MEVFTWLLMVFICYKVAGYKNRDKLAWTIYGILFGVFAVIALLILPGKEM